MFVPALIADSLSAFLNILSFGIFRSPVASFLLIIQKSQGSNMKITLRASSLLALLAVVASVAANAETGAKKNRRNNFASSDSSSDPEDGRSLIAGGSKASVSRYRYQVSLGYWHQGQYVHRCGGSLITSDMILHIFHWRTDGQTAATDHRCTPGVAGYE